jgi:gliding motility-associated-like protein
MKHYKFYQFLLCLLSLVVVNSIKAQYINVDTSSNTAAQLVAKFIGASNTSCISIIGTPTIKGGDIGTKKVNSYGYFDKGTSNFSIDEGIILSTGDAKSAAGPKGGIQTQNSGSPYFDDSWLGDDNNDLSDAIRETNIYNTTTLEFDFVTSLSNRISFDYMFASEEYYKDNCTYSDGFAFLIKEANDPLARYENIAVIPGTNSIVSVPNINTSPKCYNNPDYFGGFNTNQNVPINFGGQTIVMTAKATIKPGVQYHIKLIVGDQGSDRGLYDSAVFLKSGSFTGNIDLSPDVASNDAAVICNGVPVVLQPKNPSDITDPAATFDWYRDGVIIPLEHASSLQTNVPGNYKLRVNLITSGCTLEANTKLIDAPVALFSPLPIQLCDSNFDLDYTEILSKYNSEVITNYDSAIYDVRYYDNPTGSGIPITDFNFTQASKTLYVKAISYGCDPGLPRAVQFVHGTSLSMNYPQSQATPPTFDVCDDELQGSKEVKLEALVDSEMTTERNTIKKFYNTEAEAKKGGSSTVTNINPVLSPTNLEKTYFVRIEDLNSKFCPNYSSFRILFKQPKRSAVLRDTVICKGTKINLETEPDFDSYRWYDKEDPLKTTITTSNKTPELPAGNYVVELGYNDCLYSQDVRISEPADLVISNVLIEGNTVTVLAANGIPPYRYKLDNGSYQFSNVFDNVPKGDHTIEVIDACGFLTRDFSIINIKNVITPNNDGVNDFIDYSDLMTKSEPRLEVYDRNGVLVFKGDTNNNFIWNGKLNGRILPTSSYWYILEWTESGNPTRTQLSGWILMKNRD